MPHWTELLPELSTRMRDLHRELNSVDAKISKLDEIRSDIVSQLDGLAEDDWTEDERWKAIRRYEQELTKGET